MTYDSVYALAGEIKKSEAYESYKAMEEVVMQDETNRALLKEYRKMQAKLQMGSLMNTQPSQEDTERFSGLTSLLFANEAVSNYLLAEMRLQQALGEIIKILTNEIGLHIELPGRA